MLSSARSNTESTFAKYNESVEKKTDDKVQIVFPQLKLPKFKKMPIMELLRKSDNDLRKE